MPAPGLYALFTGAGGAYSENVAPDPGSCPVNTAGAARDPDFFLCSGGRPQGSGKRRAKARQVPPQEYPRIITGADAGERGGWPELVRMSRGRGPFND